MESLSGGLLLFLLIVLSAFCWITYHRLFDVMYFDLGHGILKELIGSFIAGFILLALICWVWWLVAIILGIIAASSFKAGKSGLAILCAIMIIVVAIVGISVKNNSSENAKNTAAAEEISYTLSEAENLYSDCPLPVGI